MAVLGLGGVFSRIPGVEQTTVGYTNGQVETTNYQLIKETDHAETVQVIYDPNKITLRAILLYYFRVIDPCPLTSKEMIAAANIGPVSIIQTKQTVK